MLGSGVTALGSVTWSDLIHTGVTEIASLDADVVRRLQNIFLSAVSYELSLPGDIAPFLVRDSHDLF
jgi:hypothetical protein